MAIPFKKSRKVDSISEASIYNKVEYLKFVIEEEREDLMEVCVQNFENGLRKEDFKILCSAPLKFVPMWINTPKNLKYMT